MPLRLFLPLPQLLLLLLVPIRLLAFEAEEKDQAVYGFNIHYAEAGEGPVVLLLHGPWGGTNEWEAVVAPLAAGHRIIAMDFLGFHGSDKPDAVLASVVPFLESLPEENP